MPSEDEILRLWKLYDEAEAYIAEISSLWDGLEVTAVNQLRYSGRHVLNALTGNTSLNAEEEYRRAVSHAKRAIFDALDSGIIFCLQKIDIFKQDYRRIEITTPGYHDTIRAARKSKALLDDARRKYDTRHDFYEEAREHFAILKEACEVLEDSRPEQNKRLAAHNRNIIFAWATLGIGLLSLAVVLATG